MEAYPHVIFAQFSSGLCIGYSVLVHDPIRLLATWWLPEIENQCLLDPNKLAFVLDFLIGSCGLPIPVTSRSVRSVSIWIFSISWCEEVPIVVP